MRNHQHMCICLRRVNECDVGSYLLLEMMGGLVHCPPDDRNYTNHINNMLSAL